MTRENGKLSRFGSTVMSLCAERGIRTRKELVDRIGKAGYERETKAGETAARFSHAVIGNYVYGEAAVNRTFCRALLDALQLTGEERIRLAEAYTFGQDEEVDFAVFERGKDSAA